MADAFDDDNESTRGLEIPELLDRRVRQVLAEQVRSCIPASVQHFDPATCKADVQPLVKDFHRDETGALVVVSMPLIPGVAVHYLSAGGFTFSVPIVAGGASATTGTLFFAERSLDRWHSGQGQEVDPGIYTRFALTDGIFIPGLSPFGAPRAAPPTDHAFAGKAGGVGIHFRDSIICIGDESGSDFLALAALVRAQLDAIHAALGSLQCPNTGTGSAVTVAATSPYSPSDVAATEAMGK